MAKSGKASIKRGKPSYFMSIVGVTLVLFLLGIIGWLVILANKIGGNFQESVEINVFLRGELNPTDSAALVSYISSRPYVKKYAYVTKEMAKKRFLGDASNEDWDKILSENPLPPSIDFTLKKEYVNSDSLAAIKADIEQRTYVDEVKYQKELVNKLTDRIRSISIGLLILAIVLTLVVIILIDNTIRLAMFSSRFLIKTMQMVGATRWFIAKPMNNRAIINGAVSGLLASGLLWLLVYFIEKSIPYSNESSNYNYLLLLCAGLVVLGILISLFSTYRSVLKYLRMRLDDLY